MFTLLNCLFESGIPVKLARNELPELDYLTQITIELWERTPNTSSGDREYSVKISVSPGCTSSDPLDMALDSRHTIAVSPRRGLTRHLDLRLMENLMNEKFKRVVMPKRFLPINITGDLS